MLPHELDQSYGQLITSGCDQRIVVGDDGLTAYGTGIFNRRALSLGSCSCSSPSERATRAARNALDQLRGASNVERVFTNIQSDLRETLRETLQLPCDSAIAFTPSGTDVEMLAAYLVAGADDRDLVNIVVGDGEVGSGTALSAAIKHYNSRLPRGGESIAGQTVNQAFSDRVQLHPIAVRDRYGERLLPLEIDAEVMDAVVAGVERGARVLVHQVAPSKTGIHAPSLTLMDQIQRTMGDDVVGIVDAAQARLDLSAYRIALQKGWLVSITGSKFFGGPPFSGALLVPGSLANKLPTRTALPNGFADYFSMHDLPSQWLDDGPLDSWRNIGGLLRWVAAAAEIRAFTSIDWGTRDQIATEFAHAITKTFSESTSLSLLDQHAGYDAGTTFDEICGSSTIFSMELANHQGQSLGKDDLQRVHRQLNKVSGGIAFHLGQPVQIGENRSVIRVALGAPMMIAVAQDRALGDKLNNRITTMKNHIHDLDQRLSQTIPEMNPEKQSAPTS